MHVGLYTFVYTSFEVSKRVAFLLWYAENVLVVLDDFCCSDSNVKWCKRVCIFLLSAF